MKTTNHRHITAIVNMLLCLYLNETNHSELNEAAASTEHYELKVSRGVESRFGASSEIKRPALSFSLSLVILYCDPLLYICILSAVQTSGISCICIYIYIP